MTRAQRICGKSVGRVKDADEGDAGTSCKGKGVESGPELVYPAPASNQVRPWQEQLGDAGKEPLRHERRPCTKSKQLQPGANGKHLVG